MYSLSTPQNEVPGMKGSSFGFLITCISLSLVSVLSSSSVPLPINKGDFKINVPVIIIFPIRPALFTHLHRLSHLLQFSWQIENNFADIQSKNYHYNYQYLHQVF